MNSSISGSTTVTALRLSDCWPPYECKGVGKGGGGGGGGGGGAEAPPDCYFENYCKRMLKNNRGKNSFQVISMQFTYKN